MIAVIIPAYNAARTLAACLQALNAQTVPREVYEIIVVDDGSADDTAQRAVTAGARVIRQENAGAAAAGNRGAEAALGALLLFTDSDCVSAPDWVEAMVATFSDASGAGARGRAGRGAEHNGAWSGGGGTEGVRRKVSQPVRVS